MPKYHVRYEATAWIAVEVEADHPEHARLVAPKVADDVLRGLQEASDHVWLYVSVDDVVADRVEEVEE